MGKRQRRRNTETIRHAEAAGLPLTSEPLDLDEAGLRTDGTVPIKIISPGWGSKGYYSEEVLKRDGPKAWPAGTHMYFNHPTVTEEAERPERSLRDLAAVTESTPVWHDETTAPGGRGAGLYAEAQVFPQYREAIAAMAPHIGVSIRARGTGQRNGEAEGRRGTIVESIDRGLSIDFVTKAGRGGEVLALAEAAGLDLAEGEEVDLDEAGTVSGWFESRIHSDFTVRADDMYGDGRLTRAERIALSNAIGDALDAFTAAVTAKAPQLLDRNRWDDPDPTTDPLEESAMNLSEADKKALFTEFRESVLEEVRGEVKKTHETELAEAKAATAAEKERADKATGALMLGEAQRMVLADEAVKALPEHVQTRIAEAAVRSTLPTTDDGKLDTAKLTESVGKLVDDEVKYLEAAGVKVGGGQVTGAGASTTSTGKPAGGGTGEQLDEAAIEKQLRGTFGLTEAAKD